MEVSCARCGHPGVHATILPPGGGGSGRCPDCPQCQQEEAEGASLQEEKTQALEKAEEELRIAMRDLGQARRQGNSALIGFAQATVDELKAKIELISGAR